MGEKLIGNVVSNHATMTIEIRKGEHLMNTHKTKIFMTAVAVLMAVMTWTGSAQAGRDGKSYTGLMCKDQYGPTSNRSNVTYSSRGGISNMSYTKVVRVNCVIIKDNNAGKGGIDEVTVFYSDNHPTRKLTCKVELRKGDAKRSLIRRAEEDSPKGVHNGAFTVYGPSVRSAEYHYYYSLSCYLPPRTKAAINSVSTLHSYTVVEHENG